jgi:hypothetical protein
MSLQERVIRAIDAHVESVEAPSFDITAIRSGARRRARRRAGVAAAIVAVAGATALGSALTSRSGSDAGPADIAEWTDSLGLRAFVDAPRGVLHLGNVEVPLDQMPGVEDTGLATPEGILYLTPEQELRRVEPSGRHAVLLPAVGTPPPGFVPSVAYDRTSGLAVAVRLMPDGNAVVTAYDLVTQDVQGRAGRLMSERGHDRRDIWVADPTEVAVAGVDRGVAFLSWRGAGTLSWIPDWGFSEYSWLQTIDVEDEVVLLAPEGDDDLADLTYTDVPVHASPESRWRATPGSPTERLAPDGAYRADAAWRSLAEVPMLMPTSGSSDPVPVRGLPSEGQVSLTFDTDGSVLAAVESPRRARTVFDCDISEGACQTVAEASSGGDVGFLDGWR